MQQNLSDISGKKILIATPVNNREKYLPHFLKHIYSIDYDKKNIQLYFLLNNSNDNSKNILFEFMKKYEREYQSIVVDNFNSGLRFNDQRITSIRNKFTYNHLSLVRNALLDYARKKEVDYLLSVDSDILVPCNILTKLINSKKNIVSSLIYNGYLVEPDKPWKYTNIMRYESGSIEHISNWYTKNALSLSESKVVPVDITGAISLISKKVLDSGVKYGYHPKGEDIYFSLDAKSKGFQSYCDLSCFSHHIMSEKQLESIKL